MSDDEKVFQLPDLRGGFVRAEPDAYSGGLTDHCEGFRLAEDERGDWHCPGCGQLIYMKPDGRALDTKGLWED